MILSAITLKFISKQFRNTDSILGRISSLINRDNSIHVTTTNIDPKSIEIIWRPDYLDSRIVHKNGVSKSKIGHEYGQNYFQINHNGSNISSVGHFKTNNWHSHNYRFEIVMDQEYYITSFQAIGPNSFETVDTTEINE